MDAAVKIENLTLSYQRHPAVHHLRGEFTRAGMYAVTGPNGGGKSTLIKALAGLLRPDEGRIEHQFDRHEIGYIPQLAEVERSVPATVLQLVSMGLWRQCGRFGHIHSAARQQAIESLWQVGLRGMEQRLVSELSAGQLQRALFARLILQDPSLILLDEPFSALDESTMRHLFSLLHQWHAQGKTIICVLHDMEQIRQHFPYCLLLARECIAWDMTSRALKPENLLAARSFQHADPHPALCGKAV